jgi:two-component system response regulator NreC
MYVDPSMLRSLLGESKPLSQEQSTPLEILTPRETEILKLIVEGYTNRQVSEHLNISIRTVEGHRANISDKLGLHSRLEFVRYARQHGIIE